MMQEFDFQCRFGAWMQRERKLKKLTQFQLAQVLKMAPSQLSEIESGKRGVTAYQFYQACFWLGAFPEELF